MLQVSFWFSFATSTAVNASTARKIVIKLSYVLTYCTFNILGVSLSPKLDFCAHFSIYYQEANIDWGCNAQSKKNLRVLMPNSMLIWSNGDTIDKFYNLDRQLRQINSIDNRSLP